MGKLEQYELGKWLRLTYGKFLPPKYSNFDISVRSTDVDRTLMSAESNLAGLYPPTESDSWFKDIKWQPIPIHTIPEKEDAVLAGHKSCPKYDQLYSELFKSGYYADLNNKLGHLYEYMSEHAGYKVDMLQVTHLFSTFYIEELYNYTLPNWTHAVYPNQMRGILNRIVIDYKNKFSDSTRLTDNKERQKISHADSMENVIFPGLWGRLFGLTHTLTLNQG